MSDPTPEIGGVAETRLRVAADGRRRVAADGRIRAAAGTVVCDREAQLSVPVGVDADNVR